MGLYFFCFERQRCGHENISSRYLTFFALKNRTWWKVSEIVFKILKTLKIVGLLYFELDLQLDVEVSRIGSPLALKLTWNAENSDKPTPIENVDVIKVKNSSFVNQEG